MNIGRVLLISGQWLLSATGVGYAVYGYQQIQGPGPGIVISGENLGFRVEGHHGEARTGTLVVKIDGKWVEARSAVKLVQIK